MSAPAPPTTGNSPPLRDLAPVLDQLIEPATAQLATRLRACAALGEAERRATVAGVAGSLRGEVWRRVSRVLLLELNAARMTGQLSSATPAQRWREWVASASAPPFWTSLTGRYPTLLPRLRGIITARIAAAASAAERFAADRAVLPTLGLADPELSRLIPTQGDSHRGGQTVMAVESGDDRVYYKPRPLDVDRALGHLLPRVLPDEPAATRIRTPRVICRDGYGWAEHVPHRYCAGPAELAAFYRGIGHWLAILQLLGGSDLHAENLIAAGPVPVVVDCEALFTPQWPLAASGWGRAVDRAMSLVVGSVLRTGLLPVRGAVCALRGADISATGQLDGQQPELSVPTIVEAGTDAARFGFTTTTRPGAANHPSPQPALREHWGAVLDGLTELTAQLTRLDQAGSLAMLLAPFRDCQIRLVPRDTALYSEVGRMLWHPISLHDAAKARARAADLLTRHGHAAAAAPTDPVVIAAEIADLSAGDIPSFTALAGQGQMIGPQGVPAGELGDLVEAALDRWRGLDPALDRLITQSAVISAYLNDTGPERLDADEPPGPPLHPVAAPEAGTAERHRRTLAATAVSRLVETALPGDDGTTTWIAPVLGRAGWQIQPLPADLYNGVAGIAVALAGYQVEVAAGRADPVVGVAELRDATLRSLRVMTDHSLARRAASPAAPPEQPGGYVGLASQIWAWLLLRRLGCVAGDEAIAQATRLAGLLPAAIAADETCDLLGGAAGAVVPLLRLAELTEPERWHSLAERIGDQLAEQAVWSADRVGWCSGGATPIGGLAHGATGVGWALARLAEATGADRFDSLAAAAFRLEESFFEPARRGWLDRRYPRPQTAAWWCHGAAGIGIVAADLGRRRDDPRWRELVRRAAASTWPAGMGPTHTLCHGALGGWELLATALAGEDGPAGLDRSILDGQVLGSLARFGPRCHATVDVFVPGLLHGLAGVVYQLLRMHPASRLPSVLLPDPAA